MGQLRIIGFGPVRKSIDGLYRHGYVSIRFFALEGSVDKREIEFPDLSACGSIPFAHVRHAFASRYPRTGHFAWDICKKLTALK